MLRSYIGVVAVAAALLAAALLAAALLAAALLAVALWRADHGEWFHTVSLLALGASVSVVSHVGVWEGLVFRGSKPVVSHHV